MNQTINEIVPGCFVFEQKNALPKDVCAEIIQRFEASTADQYHGRIGQQAEQDSTVKKSTDLVVSGNPGWKDIDHNLFISLDRAMREFKQRYQFFKAGFKDMGYAV